MESITNGPPVGAWPTTVALGHPGQSLTRKRKFCFAAFITVSALFALELGARGFLFLSGYAALLQHDAALGWRLTPFCVRRQTLEDQPYTIELNANGLRDDDHLTARIPGKRRVLALGDSFVFGSGGVSRSATFCDLLEQRWPDVEVINFGVPGYSTDQQYTMLRRDGLKYRADLVILFVYANDFAQSFRSYAECIGRPKGRLSPDSTKLRFFPAPERCWIDWASDYAASALAVDRALLLSPRHYRRMQEGEGVDDELHRRAYGLLLQEFAELARSNGSRMAYVYLPSRDQKAPTVEQTLLHEAIATIEGGMFDMTETAPFDAADSRQTLYFHHDIHWNELGHHRAAELLAPRILQWLSEPKP